MSNFALKLECLVNNRSNYITSVRLFTFGGVEGNRTPVRRTPNDGVYSLGLAFYVRGSARSVFL